MSSLQSDLARARRELAALSTVIRPRVVEPVEHVSAIEFATGAKFLNLGLYPVQGFLVKLIAGQTETFTDYDWRLLEEWTCGYVVADDNDRRRHVGNHGISPDVLQRIDWLHENGAAGFREVITVCGRRFGKSYLGAVSVLYRLWQMFEYGDVHAHFGIDRDKVLLIPVVSGSQSRSRRDQYGDIAMLVSRAPCFKPYVVERSASTVSLTTPAGLCRAVDGVPPVLVQISAVETTTLSTRGPAIPITVNDEVAHLIGAGSTADYADLYAATLPATAQFGASGMIWMASSPATQEGQFYDSYCRALSVDESGEPAEPDMLTIQLESWDAYRDWGIAHTIETYPGGPYYTAKHRPIIEYDDQMRRQEHDNPSTFEVEQRGHWATVLDAYLPSRFVDDLYLPVHGRVLLNNQPPVGAFSYFGHGDPSKSQAGFGFAVGHQEIIDGTPHIFFDVLHAWNPRDFGGTQDYIAIGDEIFEIAIRYNLTELTFDQFSSTETIQRLQRRLKEYRARTRVREKTENHASNWTTAEAFKTLLGQRRVHAPRHTLADAELRSLQLVGMQRVGPSKLAPVRTCDIADSMIAVVARIQNDNKNSDTDRQFSEAHPSGIRNTAAPRRAPYNPGRRRPTWT